MSRIEEPGGTPCRFERRLNGLPVGAGIAVGPVFGTIEAPATFNRHRIAAADIEAERVRLDAAVTASRKQLGKLRARLHVLARGYPGRDRAVAGCLCPDARAVPPAAGHADAYRPRASDRPNRR